MIVTADIYVIIFAAIFMSAFLTFTLADDICYGSPIFAAYVIAR